MYKLHWYSTVLNQPVIEIRPDPPSIAQSLDTMLGYIMLGDFYLGRYTVVNMRYDGQRMILVPPNAPEHAMMVEKIT